MLTIVYDPDHGTAVPDGKIAEWVNDFVVPTGAVCPAGSVMIASELAIRAVRNAILEGRVSRDNVQFEFRGVTITMDSDGLFIPYPVGFCDIAYNLHHEALYLRFNKSNNTELA